ncbi:MAG: VOC family protein [Dehalococcoidia bacterium]|jgi:predicted enzyme related to lactoylglutathione lyase
MNVVDWFEIPVKDMARAKTFYQKVFGKQASDMSMNMPGMEYAAFPMEQNAPMASGALLKSKAAKPSKDGVTIYFYCDDVAVELARVAPAGGKVVFPKTGIGDAGFMGQIIDTEGNRIGLHSMK